MEENLNRMIDEIHSLAIEKGWWDTDRPLSETLMLICSEWSEAIEEARAGHPEHYYQKKPECDECMLEDESDPICVFCACPSKRKPEGVCVELIDGVIRIFDFLGYVGAEMEGPGTLEEAAELEDVSDMSLCEIVHALTQLTSDIETVDVNAVESLLRCVSIVSGYCIAHGFDPELLLWEKHEYNKLRPRKHGKRF